MGGVQTEGDTPSSPFIEPIENFESPDVCEKVVFKLLVPFINEYRYSSTIRRTDAVLIFQTVYAE